MVSDPVSCPECGALVEVFLTDASMTAERCTGCGRRRVLTGRAARAVTLDARTALARQEAEVRALWEENRDSRTAAAEASRARGLTREVCRGGRPPRIDAETTRAAYERWVGGQSLAVLTVAYRLPVHVVRRALRLEAKSRGHFVGRLRMPELRHAIRQESSPTQESHG